MTILLYLGLQRWRLVSVAKLEYRKIETLKIRGSTVLLQVLTCFCHYSVGMSRMSLVITKKKKYLTEDLIQQNV